MAPFIGAAGAASIGLAVEALESPVAAITTILGRYTLQGDRSPLVLAGMASADDWSVIWEARLEACDSLAGAVRDTMRELF